MNNFDDIARKYRDEIVKLYQNQNINESEYIPPVDVSAESEMENQVQQTAVQNNENDEMYMPPAVMDNSDVYIQNSTNNMGTGFLRFDVSGADKAYPVEGALVIVTEYVNGEEKIIRIMVTDADGRTDLIELPAPLQNGTELSSERPFSTYNAMISYNGYYDVHNKNIAVFSGITSLQPVNLIPLPAYKDEREVLTFYEQEPEF